MCWFNKCYSHSIAPWETLYCTFLVHGGASEDRASQTLYQGAKWSIPRLCATISNLSFPDEGDLDIEGDCQNLCNEFWISHVVLDLNSMLYELLEKVLTYEKLSRANSIKKVAPFVFVFLSMHMQLVTIITTDVSSRTSKSTTRRASMCLHLVMKLCPWNGQILGLLLWHWRLNGSLTHLSKNV